MASADEDNFDIDIYGDGEGDMGNDGTMDYKDDDDELHFTVDEDEDIHPTTELPIKPEPKTAQPPSSTVTPQSQVKSESDQSSKPSDVPPKPAPQQGIKRKETSDERPVDHGATNALMISDLHWWTTEDDIRGWINEAGAEGELRDLTFSEHKVNGKSKGQVYLEFSSPQAATAAKHKLDSLSGNQPTSRKHSVVYTNATQNPFKTLPKDAPLRAREERPARGGTFNSGPRGDYGMNTQGFRGGRGGGFNRGGYNQNNQYNRNFSPPMGGYNNNNNNNQTQNQNVGFQGNMGMNNNYGGFTNRGGMMGNPMRGGMGGMRGGRGGMNNMMAMGGGGMAMGNMSMNPMIAGMGMGGFQGNQQGFQGNQFNPGMFNSGPGQNFGGGDWNQHGAKRQRQE